MPSYETLILIVRLIFFCGGVSCILSGFLVFAAYPIMFFAALLTILAGVMLLICCIRATHYTSREKYEKDFGS